MLLDVEFVSWHQQVAGVSFLFVFGGCFEDWEGFAVKLTILRH